MFSYIMFGIFIAFVIYMGRPQRKDKVYHSTEEVREEIKRNKDNQDNMLP